MTKILILLFLLCCHGVVHAADKGLEKTADKNLEKFVGEWNTTLIKDPVFPYWNYIAYPVSLVLGWEGNVVLDVHYEDSTGDKCKPTWAGTYRETHDAVVFGHCQATEYDSAITSHYYIVRVDGDNLIGETWNYKKLFRWSGTRASSASASKENMHISHAFKQIPDKFSGSWLISDVEKPNVFPWWDYIKYPVKLSISREDVFFEDNGGNRCKLDIRFYDKELDALLFGHCLPGQIVDVDSTPYFRVLVDGENLVVEIWRSEFLFRVKGARSDAVQKNGHSDRKQTMP